MCADEILEVVKTSRQRWTTLRGRGRDWRHNVRRREAFMRDVSSDTQTLTVFSEGFEPPDRSEQEESLWRLWISLPNTIRTEFPVGTGTVTAVLEGSTWWSISPMGARTNDGDSHVTHGTGPGYPLTDPARIPMALDLVLRGTANVAGRDALLLAGTPAGTEGIDLLDRQPTEDALDALGGAGADQYELAVDIERGVVLRGEARLEGQPFHIIEFIEIAFDETLPADAFTLGVPPGTTFESAVPRWRRDGFPD
jgi:hypothetical protein